MAIVGPDQQSEDRRTTLTRARVLEAAVALADRDGIDAVSMRNLGQGLGIEAMSLYTHIRGKDDLLDGMVDAVVAEIPVDAEGPDWMTTLRRTILDARSVMLRHRWAARVIETRSAPGLPTLAYMEAVTGIVRDGGFTVDLTHHAMHVLGSRVFGFNQDLFDDSGVPDPETAAAFAAQLASAYPNIAAIAGAASHEGGLGGCDDDYEFAFGLDLILDGLERRRVS
jgi:AcrR family transcriptional regulator